MNWNSLSTLFFKGVYKRSINSQCILCQAPSHQHICNSCLLGVHINQVHCALCRRPTEQALSLCGECQRRPPSYEYCIAPLLYEATTKAMIQAIKFRQQKYYMAPLIQLLHKEIIRHYKEQWPTQLWYVPSHPLRIKSRGFCQTREMATLLHHFLLDSHPQQAIELPSANLLTKQHNTQAQHSLHKRERIKATKNLYHCAIKPAPHIALFDDVMTTGSTIESCCKALKQAGAEKVDIWVVARTADKNH